MKYINVKGYCNAVNQASVVKEPILCPVSEQ